MAGYLHVQQQSNDLQQPERGALSGVRCALQTPDPDNKYGPKFRFGNRPYAYNPLQYIPNSNVHCMDDGSFP